MLVTIIPDEANAVFAHGLGLGRPGCGFEDRQCSGYWLDGIAGLTAILPAFFIAQSARACVAQKRKAVEAVVSVLPHNIYAGAGADVDLHGFGIGGRFHDVDASPRF